MLNAHLDTVGLGGPDGGLEPRIDGRRMYGRGSYDMKGSLAAIMTVAVAAQERELSGDLVVTAVADEEALSIGAERVAETLTADAAIVTEPTEMRLAIAHRGFVWLELETRGRAAHGSRYDLGIDANALMGPALVGLGELDGKLGTDGELHPLLGRGSTHAALVEGGTEPSTYAARCVAKVERRTLPGETVSFVEEQMREIAGAATVTTIFSREPLETPRDEAIVDVLLGNAAGVLGASPEVVGVPFWTDAAVFAAAGIPTVVFGPGGAGAHERDGVGGPRRRRAHGRDPATHCDGVLRVMDGPTPLERAPASLAEFAGREDLWLKREDLGELGMFKWRAALPVVRELARDGAGAVVTASTGNHGSAVAWACRKLGKRAVVFAPPGVTPSKLALMESLGADLRVAGRDLDEAKEAGQAWARDENLPFFEDGAEPLQYEAYRAIGDEILDQMPVAPAAVVVPIGNGALAGGVAAALGKRAPAVVRVGVVADSMPVMAESYEAGKPVIAPFGETIADGLAVRVAIPLAVERLHEALDGMIRVTERALAEALVACHDAGVAVEPSAAAAVAAVRVQPDLMGDGPLVLVMTGRNVDPAVLERARTDPGSFPD